MLRSWIRSRRVHQQRQHLRSLASPTRRFSFESLEARRVLAQFTEFLDPNPAAGNQFGATVLPLSTGNVVITAPGDDAGGSNAGAVYLFDGATGDLISTLIGSSTEDRIGDQGVLPVAGGNYVIVSSNWDNGVAVDAGAVTWGSGTHGVSGVVSADNSLVGEQEYDLSVVEVKVLRNGNYVVISSGWNLGSSEDVGAVTWAQGSKGIVGAVSATNSLVGEHTNDRIGGTVGSFAELVSGSFLIASPYWDNGTISDVGAVTWIDGNSGLTGPVSVANSLVGQQAYDYVGGIFQQGSGLTVLSGGHYVVTSPYWDNGSIEEAGAVTWGDGFVGTTGVVSAENSLVGSSEFDFIGTKADTFYNRRNTVIALKNGNYAIASPNWDNGSVAEAGAVTWSDGVSSVRGVISSENSLVGGTVQDFLGGGTDYRDGLFPLENGNFLILSPFWQNESGIEVGAVTWVDGYFGITGFVDASNSLIGATSSDRIGEDGIVELKSGNYVVASSSWNNGDVVDAGAVTWGDGYLGVKGIVSADNSLVGSHTNDFVGQFGTGIIPLYSGDYVVVTSNWDRDDVIDAGAVTVANGYSGLSGTISVENSLVGSQPYDFVGYFGLGITELAYGGFVVSSPYWDNGSIVDAGAVTLYAGAGTVTEENSLVGGHAEDLVGLDGYVIPLPNGNYLVGSPLWDNGLIEDAGAVTLVSPYQILDSGKVSYGRGYISDYESLIGSTAFDRVGSGKVTLLNDGYYLISSPDWDNGSVVDAGAITSGIATAGFTGAISADNSLVGNSAYDAIGTFTSPNTGRVSTIASLPYGGFFVGTPSFDFDSHVDVGAVTWGDGYNNILGNLTDNNTLVGSSSQPVRVVDGELPINRARNSFYIPLPDDAGGGRVLVGSVFSGFTPAPGPMNSIPGPFTTAENESIAITGLDAVATVGQSDLEVTLSSIGGTLEISPAGNAIVVYGTAANLTVRGSVNDVQATLASLQYVPLDDLSGTQIVTANDDAFPVEQGSVDVPLQVLLNDYTSQDGTLILDSVSNSTSAGGTVSIFDQGTNDRLDDVILYTPPTPSFTGIDTFEYTLRDGQNRTDSATVAIYVSGQATDFVAIDDSYSLPVSSSATLDVLANDQLGNQGPVAITSVTQPATGLGTVTISQDGQRLIYASPSDGFTGELQFSYTVTDSASPTPATHTARVTLRLGNTTSDDLVGIELLTYSLTGEPIASVGPGQEFELRAFVNDLRPAGSKTGVAAAYFDLLYASDLVTAIGPIRYNAPPAYAGGPFAYFQSGSLSQPGVIDEIGAFQFSLPSSTRQLLFTVRMRANTSGEAIFTADPADNLPLHDVLVFGSNNAVSFSNVRYGSTPLTIGTPNTIRFEGSVQVITSDLGNSGFGGPQYDVDWITVEMFNTTNDAPQNLGSQTWSATEDSPFDLASFLMISDEDSGGRDLQVSGVVTGGVLSGTAAGSADFQTTGSTFTILGSLRDINQTLANVIFTPVANANGVAQGLMQITTDDLGHSGAAPQTRSDSFVIDLLPENDEPINSVPGTLSTFENTPLAITTISIADLDSFTNPDAPLLVTLNVTGGTVSTTASGAAIVGGTGTARTITGTLSDINATLANVVFSPSVNLSGLGAATIEVVTNDQENGGSIALTDTDSLSIDIESANDAPVNNVPGTLLATEDTDLLITTISITDADSVNYPAAPLLVTLNVTGGTISATATGTAVVAGTGTARTITGTLTDINATLASVTFTPTTNLNGAGAGSIQVVTNDQGNGGGSALTDTDSVSINIAAVNDAPINNVPVTLQATEDTALLITSISIADPDSVENPSAVLQVMLNVTGGTVTATAAGAAVVAGTGTARTISGTVTDINSTLTNLTFTPTSNLNGSGAGSIQIVTNDQSNGGSGALIDTDSISVNITAVNDAPVNSVPVTLQATEDTSLLITTISISDPDSVENPSGVLQVTLNVTGGTVTATAAGAAVVAGTGATRTITGTVSDINSTFANLTFTPAINLNGTGAGSIQVVTNDQGNGGGSALIDTDSISINIAAVNDAPINNVPVTLQATEDTSLLITSISIADPDSVANTSAALQVTLNVTGGTVTATAAGAAVVAGTGTARTISGTVADINSTLANLTFTPTVNLNGSGAGSIQVVTNDQGNGGGSALTDTDSFSIDIAAVNDAPVNSVPGTLQATEDTALLITTLSITDLDSVQNSSAILQVTLNVTGGTVTATAAGAAVVAGTGTARTISGTVADINSTLANLTFTPTVNLNGSGAGSIQVVTNDQGNGGGSALTDTDSFSIDIAAVNDAPVNSVPGTLQATEDTALLITTLSISDPDSMQNSSAVLQVTLNVTGGTVTATAAGAAVVAGTGTARTISGTVADINSTLANLTFTPTANLNGTGAGSIQVVTNDQGNGGGSALIDADSISINIAAVNDAPVNSVPVTLQATEDTALLITTLSISDPDSMQNSSAVLQVTLNVTGGTVTATAAGAAVVAGTGTARTISGTVADINSTLANLTFTPTANLNGSGAGSIQVVTNDQGNGGGAAQTDTDSFSINIAAVNDAPVDSVPGSLSANEGVPLLITGLSISDIDSDSGTSATWFVTLNATGGTLSATAAGGAVVGGTAVARTISGTISDINLTLATVRYTSTKDVTGIGAGSIQIITSDQGNVGGGPLTDTDSFSINITPRPRVTQTTLGLNSLGQVELKDLLGVSNRYEISGTAAAIRVTEVTSDPAAQITITAALQAAGGSLSVDKLSVTIPRTLTIGTANVPLVMFIDAGLGDDLVTLMATGASDPLPIPVGGLSVSLGAGTDSLAVSGPTSNIWNLTGTQNGTLQLASGMVSTASFSGIENVIGGSGNDDFRLLNGNLGNGLLLIAGGEGSGLDRITATRNTATNYLLTNSRLSIDSTGANVDQTFNLQSIEQAFLTGSTAIDRFDVSGWTSGATIADSNDLGGVIASGGGSAVDTLIKRANVASFVATNSLLATSDGAQLKVQGAITFELEDLDAASPTTFDMTGYTRAAVIKGTTSNSATAAANKLVLGTSANPLLAGTVTLSDQQYVVDGRSAVNMLGVNSTEIVGGSGANIVRYRNLAMTGTSLFRGGAGIDVLDIDLSATPTLADSLLLNGNSGTGSIRKGNVAVHSLNLEDVNDVQFVGSNVVNRVELIGWAGSATLNLGDGRTDRSDLVRIDQSGLAVTQSLTVDPLGVSVTSGSSATQRISMTGVDNLDLIGGSNNDQFTITDWGTTAGGLATVQGGLGEDWLQINRDRSMSFNLGEVIIDPILSGESSKTIRYQNVDRLLATGGTSANTFTLNPGFAAAPGLGTNMQDFVIRPGGGTALDTLRAFGLTGDITIRTVDGITDLSLAGRTLRFDSLANTPELLELQGTGAATYTVTNFNAGSITFNNAQANVVWENSGAFTATSVTGEPSTIQVGGKIHTVTNVKSVTLKALGSLSGLFTINNFSRPLRLIGSAGSQDQVTYTRTGAAANFVLTDQLLTGGVQPVELSGIEVAVLNARGTRTADTFDISGFSGNGTVDGGTQSAAGRDQLIVNGRHRNTTVTSSQFSDGATSWKLVGINAVTIDNSTAMGNLFLDATSFAGTATLIGGSGNDVLIGGSGSDLLTGNAGNDWISGNDGNDVITGGSGRNVLIGGRGTDTLTGGADSDILSGGLTWYDRIGFFNGAVVTPQESKAIIDAIMNAWGSSGSAAIPQLNVTGLTVGSRTIKLEVDKPDAAVTPTTVLDDRAVDRVFRGGGYDWLFSKTKNPSQDMLDTDDAGKEDVITSLR